MRTLGKTPDSIEFFKSHAEKYITRLKDYNTRSTGFGNLDKVQVVKPGIIVMGGPPGIGKTTFIHQMAEYMAFNGTPVLYLSSEISANELYTKSIARYAKQHDSHTKITATTLEKGIFNENVQKVIEQLSAQPHKLQVEYVDDVDIDELVVYMESWYTQFPHSVIVVDYIQNIQCDKKSTAKDKIDYIAKQLQIFKGNRDVTLIVVSSFNRTSYNCDISMESFKESGGIEATAMVLWGLQYAVCANTETVTTKYGVSKGISAEERLKAESQSPQHMILRCVKNRFGKKYLLDFDFYGENDLFISVSKPTKKHTVWR